MGGTIVGRVNFDRDVFAFAQGTTSIVVSRGGETVAAQGYVAASVSLMPANYVVTARLSINPLSVPGLIQIATRLVVDGIAEDRNDGLTFRDGDPGTVNVAFILGAIVTQPTHVRLLFEPFTPDLHLRIYKAVIAAVVVDKLVVV